VIPGGVENPQELKEAMARDPVVATHYRDFNLAALRIVRLESERAVYVSYRVHNDVFWTRKQLKLRAGEKLITDGTRSARTRCGNRISTLPQARTLPSEPSAQELETPQSPELYSALNPEPPSLNKVLPFETELSPAPAAPAFVSPGGIGSVPVGGLVFPPIPGHSLFPPPCIPTKDHPCPPPPCVLTKKHPCGPPSPVPEPETWLLFVPGLAYLFYRWKYSH
jgi:hypothetical protein